MVLPSRFRGSSKRRASSAADIDGDDLYARYLAAYPPGTNPVFKTRTEMTALAAGSSSVERAGGQDRVLGAVLIFQDRGCSPWVATHCALFFHGDPGTRSCVAIRLGCLTLGRLTGGSPGV